MPTLDQFGSWISVVSSFLVFLASAMLLLAVTRRSSAGNGDSLAPDVDPMPGRVAAIRKKLATMSASGWADSTRISKFAGESDALAQHIRIFKEALAEWCDVARKYRVTNEFDRSISELDQLKDKVVRNPDSTPKARQEYFTLAGEMAAKVVSHTDRDLSKMLDTKERLDTCVRRLCAAAGVVVIEPNVGEAFDKQRHENVGEAAESARGTSQSKPKVNKVISRGVELPGARGGNKVLLMAEVEVRY